MKIGILLRILWPAGAQKIAIKEARELIKLGHDVKLYFLRSSEFSYAYDDLLRGLDYEVMSPDHRSLMTPIYSKVTRVFAKDRGDESRVDLDLIRKFPSYIKGKGLDYLICHDQWAGLAGYYTYKKHDIPYSVFIHERVSNYGVPFLGGIATRFEIEALNNALKVFAVTDKVAGTITAKYPNLKDRVIANYPGMDIKDIRPYESRENTIISVAMWDKGRKPELYLDIASRLPTYKFVMAGSWRLEDLKLKIANAVNSMGLKNVFFAEGISESQLEDLYNSSKFLIRFGFGEYGLATAVTEAIAHGTPPIINDELGTAGLIAQESAGIVIHEPDDATKAIEENDNKEKYENMQSGIRRISQTYSWANHAKRLVGGIS